MKNANVSAVNTPPVHAQSAMPAPAKDSTVVQTPSGTLSITLVPAPTPNVPLYQNVSLWAGVITFLGVVLTLIAAERRTKKELRASEERIRLEREFSSERAHQERITNARRTVYLDLIDQFSNMLQFLGRLGVSTEPPNATAEHQGLTKAVSKIALIGEIETVVIARELLMLVDQTVAKAMPIYMEITILRHNQEECSKQCTAVSEEIARLQVDIAEYNEADKHDAVRFKKLQVALEDAKTRARRYGPDLLTATTALFEKQTSYLKTTTAEAILLNRKFDDLICAIRCELGIEISRDLLKESTLRMEAAITTTSENMHTFGSTFVQTAMNMVAPENIAAAGQSQ